MIKKNIIIANRPLQRLRGLFFRKGNNVEVVLTPCCDIHTALFRRNIDVAFLNFSGEVIMTKRNLKPWSRIKNMSAYAVAERFSQPDEKWYRVGDSINKVKEYHLGGDRR